MPTWLTAWLPPPESTNAVRGPSIDGKLSDLGVIDGRMLRTGEPRATSWSGQIRNRGTIMEENDLDATAIPLAESDSGWSRRL